MSNPATLLDAYETYLQIRRQKSLADAAKIFRASISPYGFVTYACGELDLKDRDRSVYYVVDWPESWRNFYLKSKLIEHDPVIDSLAHRQEPFTWTELRHDRKFGKAGREALKLLASHGWVEGLVVPLPAGSERVGLVSLVGTQANLRPDGLAYLSLLSLGFHVHVKSLAARQPFAVRPAGLTNREIACVRLVARGQSDADIARSLGVARSTAHEFIEKAKRRLKAHTRMQMIAIAVALGIVDL
ncbi:MAG TPA: autoinducer binding domain-containing protein [Steroidobacteraceae bacterium]|nr:autoinducer binding domain-containing protein [Steroidobacteraceae bacterium]